MEHERSKRSGFSAIGMTAVFSVLVLLGAVGWTAYQAAQARTGDLAVNAGAADAHSNVPDNNADADYGVGETGTSSDPYAPAAITDNVAQKLADDYSYMQQQNYTQSEQGQVAQQLGENLKADVSYQTYTAGDIPTSPDTSYSAMLKYRAALQTSFKAMMLNQESEMDYLDEYEETQDKQYLTDLEQAADNYKQSVAATALVTVPVDAVSEQVGILNSMGEFGATLDAMAQDANDSLAEATLVNTYLQAQQDMFSSFDNLYAYFKSKQPTS